MDDGRSWAISIAAKSVVRLCHANWNEVCLIPGLVSRENSANNVDACNDTCGEAGPYLQLVIPFAMSATTLCQIANHGDYIVTLPNNKLLVVTSPLGAEVDVKEDRDSNVIELTTNFEFHARDFPKFSTWMHRNGNEYIITGYRNVPPVGEKSRPGHPVMIDYANKNSGYEYSRPAHDWYRSMTRIG